MGTDTVGIGIIGTGFGVRVQLPVWSQTPGAKVVGVCSGKLERAKQVAERFDVPHATADYDELASLPDVDLVSVATPPHLHSAGALAAIKAGKHVLCEKPFALDAAEAKEMLDRARERDVLHLTNFEFRQTPARAEMRRMIDEGFLGELSHVHTTTFGGFVRATEGRTAGWWYDTKRGGGWLGASGSHTIDMLRFFFGEITGVSAQLETVVKKHRILGAEEPIMTDVDDTFFLTLRFENGGLGALLSGAATAAGGSGMALEAYGSEGALALNGDSLLAAEKGRPEFSEVELPEPDVPMDLADPHYVPFGLWTRRIVAAVQEGTALKPDFEDGWRSQQVIDAARQSSDEGRWVDIPL